MNRFIQLPLFLITINCWFVNAYGISSTAYNDVTRILSNHSDELLVDSLARDFLYQQLPKLDDDAELSDVKDSITSYVDGEFLRSVERKNQWIFRNESKSDGLLETFRREQFFNDGEFLNKILNGLQQNTTSTQLNVYENEDWIQYSRKYLKSSHVDAFKEILLGSSINQNLGRHLPLLYYGYTAFGEADSNFESYLDKYVEDSHLTASHMDPQSMETLYKQFQPSLFKQKFSRKYRQFMGQMANHLFKNIPTPQWSGMSQETLLEMAQALEDSSETTVKDWMKKMGETASEHPFNNQLLARLTYFIQNSDVNLAESYRLQTHLFEEDQVFFEHLHNHSGSSSCMLVWNKNKSNRTHSLELLKNFWQLEKQERWTQTLWQCLKVNYYGTYEETRDDLFDSTILLIARELSAQRHWAKDVIYTWPLESNSSLKHSHRYEIAHHLIRDRKLTDSVEIGGQSQLVLDYCVRVYTQLDQDGDELYKSKVLRNRLNNLGISIPRSTTAKRLSFIDAIMSEPLEIMCNAFMNKTELTNGLLMSFDNASDVNLLETMLTKLNVLKTNFTRFSKKPFPKLNILEQISEEISREIEKAVLNNDRAKIVQMTRLILKITVLLEEDDYLKEVLVALREKVFGISEDTTLFRKLNQEDLSEIVLRFKQFHSQDLVAAIRAVGDVKYVDMFYRELYMPLRSIYGFLRSVGPEPFFLYIREMTQEMGHYPKIKQVRSQLRQELDSFDQLHQSSGERTGCYLNSEDAIIELLGFYMEQLSTDLWVDPDILTLSENINLSVFYALLTEKVADSEAWKLKSLSSDKERADQYQKILNIFLDYSEEPTFWLKPTELFDAEATYSIWDFFSFLNTLMHLFEVYDSPIPGFKPESHFEEFKQSGNNNKGGFPKKGLKLATLPIGTRSIGTNRPVDGFNRFHLYEKLSGAQVSPNKAQIEQLIKLALLLPNKKENHGNANQPLSDFFQIKSKLFQSATNELRLEIDPERRLRWLQWLCRLEASVHGLQDAKLGYGPIRREEFGRIKNPSINSETAKALYSIQLSIIFEEFKLLRVNQPAFEDSSSGDLIQLSNLVGSVAQRITEAYTILQKQRKYDRISNALLEMARSSTKDKVLERLRDSDIPQLWFLTTQCQKALEKALEIKEERALSDEEKMAIVKLASSMTFIHSYFLPYTHGDIDAEALFRLNYLQLFMMLNREVKGALVSLLADYDQGFPSFDNLAKSSSTNEMLPMEPDVLRTFFISHNFLPLHLLNESLNKPELFADLVKGKEVRLSTYDFHWLWEMEENGQLGMDDLCSEVFQGVNLNRELLSSHKTLRDWDYYEYLFGDMRAVIDDNVKLNGNLPQNLDQVVAHFASLPEDTRLDNINTYLSNERNSLFNQKRDQAADKSIDSQIHRMDTALAGLEEFPKNIDSVLSQSWKFFGELLAENYNDVFYIQKTIEEAVTHIYAFEKNSDYSDSAKSRYNNFYSSSLFDGSSFNSELAANMVQSFYRPKRGGVESPNYSDWQSDFFLLIDGKELNSRKGRSTEGIKYHAISNSSSEKIGQLHLSSNLQLLESIFMGEHLNEETLFIGHMLFDKNEEGIPIHKSLNYSDGQEDVFKLLSWIYEGHKRYQSVPPLQKLFFTDPEIDDLEE